MTVETPRGLEAYGVLVARAGDLWRARVLTYPNVLWTIPGGAVTIKFAGESAQEAEARAVAFVDAHVRAQGYVRRDGLDVSKAGAIDGESLMQQLAAAAAVRKLRALPVRFGRGASLFTAMTANLSQSGLFLVTLAPFEAGTDLRVLMEIETGPVGLKGQVVWKRERPVMGRPMGMGIQLIEPPDPYRDFVIELP